MHNLVAPHHRVLLVDLGPGDPGLWTLRAKAYLEQADCVLTDSPLPAEVAAAVPPRAKIILLSTLESLETDVLLRAHLQEMLQQKKVVIRLPLARRGEPGALFEEAESLHALGFPCELALGLSAVEAVPAYAGVPWLNQAGPSTLRALIWRSPSKSGIPADLLRGMANRDELWVCLTSPAALPSLIDALLQSGHDPQTPVALIEQGTLPGQQTLWASLNRLPSLDRALDPDASLVLVVGAEAGRPTALRWFETRPLYGQKILVTRARPQADALSALLQAYGAAVLEIPTIAIGPPSDWAPLDAALDTLERYDWLCFTSVNGVEAFFSRLLSRKKDLRDLKGQRLCAIGPATARAIERYHLRVDLMPPEYRAEAVLPALERYLGSAERLRGLAFLLPRAKVARDVLPQELRRAGAHIEVVEAYQTVLPRNHATQLREALAHRDVDGITFTSSSTVSNLAALLEGEDIGAALRDVWVACIGPITAKTAQTYGLRNDILPKDYTIPALVDAIVEKLTKGS